MIGHSFTPHKHEHWASLLLVVLGAAVLGPHVLDAGPYSVDLAELTLCAWSGGVPHSPGYPLWTRLAQGALLLQDATDPFHALGRFAVVLAILAAVITKGLLRRWGIELWTATACASLMVVIPQCIRAFTISEVYALDLFLLAMSVWAGQRGHMQRHKGWIALGVATAILSIGHRPINIVLLAALPLAWPQFRKHTTGVAAGIGAGLTVQGMLYWDLWRRIREADALWIDEHVQATWTSFSRFVVGLPFEHFLVWADDPLSADFHPWSLGAQCLGLIVAAVMIPAVNRRSRVHWGLWLIAIWHLAFLFVFRVVDRDFFVFPIIWVGSLSVALSTLRLPQTIHHHLGRVLLIGVVGLSITNRAGLPAIGHDQWRDPLRETLKAMPPHSIILTDDFPVRSGLIALREMEGLGPTLSVVRISLEGGDIQRLGEWFDGKIPLLLLEERDEIKDLRPVRVHDSRLLPLLIQEDLVTRPAEAGTWSVEKASQQ